MKRWYQSKTIIVNLLAGLLGVIPLINEDILTTIGILDTKGYLSILGLITTVLNLFLRVVTTGQVITSKKEIL